MPHPFLKHIMAVGKECDGASSDHDMSDRGQNTARSSRLSCLDGLRGIAALVVVIFHVLAAVVPTLTPDQTDSASWIASTPVAVAWNGPFAVAIFFTLSGFVVSHAAISRPEPLWVKVSIRYLRLAVPVTASVIFAWILLTLIPNAANELYLQTYRRWLQYTYQAPIPSFASAVYDGLIGNFVTGGSQFNNVLWTMRPELVGSFACYAIGHFQRISIRVALTLVFAIAVIASHRLMLGSFVVGICMREAWAAGKLGSVGARTALLAGLVIGSQSSSLPLFGRDGVARFMHPGQQTDIVYPIGAALVVYACLASPPLRRLLSNRSCTFLGKISFPLYLIHVPLIYTVLCRALLATAGRFVETWLCVLVFIGGCLTLSAILERHLERHFLALLKPLGRKMGGAPRTQ